MQELEGQPLQPALRVYTDEHIEDRIIITITTIITMVITRMDTITKMVIIINTRAHHTLVDI